MSAAHRLGPTVFAVLLLLAGCDAPVSGPAEPVPDELAAHRFKDGQPTSSPVYVHPSQDATAPEIAGAIAKLQSTEYGVYLYLRAAALQPGNAYTIWWVIFNAPENCAGGLFGGRQLNCVGGDALFNDAVVLGEVAYATGRVAGSSGEGQFTALLRKGSVPGGWFGNGLTNPQGAEIHFVMMDHGPAIPGLVENQISTLRGGCTDESVPKAFPPVAHADGIPGPNTCRLVQFGVFEQ